MENTNSKIANQDLDQLIFNGFSQERFFAVEEYPLVPTHLRHSVDKILVIDELLSANINELTKRSRQEKI